MDATLIVIDSDAELVRARALVDRLMASSEPADHARLEAQARLIAAYDGNGDAGLHKIPVHIPQRNRPPQRGRHCGARDEANLAVVGADG